MAVSDNGFRRELGFASKYPAYKRVWDIVLEEGAEKIISEFRQRVK